MVIILQEIWKTLERFFLGSQAVLKRDFIGTLPTICQERKDQQKTLVGNGYHTLSIRLYVLRKGLTLQSYCGDGIGTIKPTLGKGMDP